MDIRKFFSRLLLSLCFFSGILSAAPVITNVSPASDFGGFQSVTILGSGFTGATNVDFGNVPAASFIVNSDTSISALSPIHSPGVVTIFVTTPSGTSTVSPTSYFTVQGNWYGFVTNNEDDTVSVFFSQFAFPFTTIGVGDAPNALDILPDGSKVYIGNSGDNTVSVIDYANLTVVNTIPTTGILPFDITVMVVTPDGSKNYIVNQRSNNVTVIDNSTETVIATIPVGDRPFNIALTPDGTKAYVLNANDNTVSVISIASDTVIATIPVGNFPLAASSVPDSSKVYVVNANDGTVSVISTATDTVITTITVGSFPRGLAVTPDGSKVFVTNAVSSDVSVISTATDTVIATIPVGAGPSVINITPDGTQAYVVNQSAGTVSAINVATDTVTATIVVGGDIQAQAITPDGLRVYEVDFDNNQLVVISTVTNTVTGNVPVGGEPSAIQLVADQAPLAQFNVYPQGVGLPTTFDASQSVSPTGDIANYFWDFGDGSPTVNTADPLITHIYQAPGTYNVTLIVTNTAGTSLTQIFSFASASSSFSQTGSPVTTNNGGPTARRINQVTIGLTPPFDFTGCIKKNVFLNRTELTLNGTFTASPIPGIVLYRIFNNNGKVVLEIPANGLLSFTICLKSQQSAGGFSIAAVAAGNAESVRVPITITGSCCSAR